MDAPSCLVLDVRLPGTSGLELQALLGGRDAALPIIFISGHGDIPMSVRAIKAGALDFLPKPFGDEVFLNAVNEALARDRDTIAARTETAGLRARFARLSAREREVTVRVVRGMLNKQIAAELDITETTVKVHRRNVMGKLGVHSVPELVRAAARVGLTD
jgi:FixJ family two-component response regulator